MKNLKIGIGIVFGIALILAIVMLVTAGIPVTKPGISHTIPAGE